MDEEKKFPPRPDIDVPQGMRIVWCDWMDNLHAYVLMPEVWLVEHVEVYFLAKDELRRSTPKGEVVTTFVSELAGLLALSEAGFIEIHNVAGLDADPAKWDLKKVPATVLGWLRLAVASTIEATQRSPLPLYAALLAGGKT